MKRLVFVAIGVVLCFVVLNCPATQIRAQRRADGGVGAQPNHDPRTLVEADVDVLMWPIVQRINRSGWVWTTESCQGHVDPVRPASLGVVTDDPGRFFALLMAVHTDAFAAVSRESQDPHGWQLQLWQRPRVLGLGGSQIRIRAHGPADTALFVFEMLAERVTP